MHRTHCVPYCLIGSMLVGAVLAHLAGSSTVAAQEQAPPPRPQLVPAPSPTAADQIIAIGIGASKRIQMKGGLRISRIESANPDVATADIDPTDPTLARITGRQAGVTRVVVTAANAERTEEIWEIRVQLDVEFLLTLIRQATPTSSVQLIPAGSAGQVTSLLISGTVTDPEDINIIMKVAESVVGRGNAINAMRVNGVQQVQLDCVVAQVSRTELRNMSFDFINQGNNHTLASTIGGAILGPTALIGPQNPSGFALSNTIGAPNGLPANFFLGLFNTNQLFYGYLQLLRQEKLAKFLAEPRLTVLSGHQAQFLAGGQQAVPSPGGLGAVSVQFVPFGTQLNFMPIVLSNGKIYLEVAPSISELDAAAGAIINGFNVLGRTNQLVHTSVIMEDGQTFVIGGLIQNQVQGSTSKVPVLGDLPWIGAAFSSKSFSEVEQEVVIMVTPHLVDPMSCAQVPKILPGQETRSPDDYELFLEGILEAPRGPRAVSPHRQFTPAYKNGPTGATVPCAPTWLSYQGAAGAAVPGCADAKLGLAGASSVSYPGGNPAPTPESSAAVMPASKPVGLGESAAYSADQAVSDDILGTRKPITPSSLPAPAGDGGRP